MPVVGHHPSLRDLEAHDLRLTFGVRGHEPHTSRVVRVDVIKDLLAIGGGINIVRLTEPLSNLRLRGYSKLKETLKNALLSAIRPREAFFPSDSLDVPGILGFLSHFRIVFISFCFLWTQCPYVTLSNFLRAMYRLARPHATNSRVAFFARPR